MRFETPPPTRSRKVTSGIGLVSDFFFDSDSDSDSDKTPKKKVRLRQKVRQNHFLAVRQNEFFFFLSDTISDNALKITEKG